MRRVGTGLAISLALHAALLLAWRLGAPVGVVDNTPVRSSIMVRLQAPPPPEPEPIKEEAPPEVKQAPRKAVAQRPRAADKPRDTPELIALPARPSEPGPDPEFTVAPSVPTSEDAPKFDPEAARKFARSIANEPDPARAGMAVAQIPPKPLATGTKAERLIAGAKRRNCKDGLPGGLLGPLLILLDKKDSGCKW